MPADAKASLKPFLAEQRSIFAKNLVESAELSADLLLAAALEIDRAELLKRLILNPEQPVSTEQQKIFTTFKNRRLNGEPIAYILGKKEFYGRSFQVNPAVLIPRPETELLIDCAKSFFFAQPEGNFADLGTGSGCIAITLALELGKGWKGLALDNSAPALATASQNALNLDAAGQIDFRLHSFKDYHFTPGSLDLFASNPPYISEDEYSGLDKTVRSFEPKSALVPSGIAESNGCEDLFYLTELALKSLRKGGLMLIEIGFWQGPYMKAQLEHQKSWAAIDIIKDLASLDRLVWACRA